MSNNKKDEIISTTLSVTIPTFSEKYVENKNVTFYNIEVLNNYSKQNWGLEKRYSDFDDLFKALAKLLPNVPQIPGKSFFKITSYDGLNKRKNQLEQFLKDCVARKDILNNESFRDFIEVDKHSPEMAINNPVLLSEFNDLPLGIRDFIYLKYENIIFAACSDMNITSRLDSYITNVNLPWEKKTDAHISVGAAFAYKLTTDSNKSFYFEKLWAKSYPKQTGCISWDGESSTLAIGLDDGKIYFYKVAPDSNFLQYEELCELKPHSNRIMGIAFDSKTGYIYSCSSDKKFIISEINYQESVTEVTTGSHGFTNLNYDRKNERIFLSNEVGVISVYSVSTFPPTLLCSVQTSSKSSIRGMTIDLKKYYIFTGSMAGKISLIDLGPPGKERFIKEVTSFGGNLKIRSLKYNSSANEIITGDEAGKIVIWSLKTGQPIFAFQAHKEAITQMFFEEDSRLLITGGKEKSLKFWKLPEKWMNEEIVNFEENEIKNMKDSLAMLKLQRTLTKDEYDSSDDDLNGWDHK